MTNNDKKKTQKDWDPNWDPKWCTPEDLDSPDEEYVCTCWGITVGDIKQKTSECDTIQDVVNETGLGTSCGLCINRFEYMFQEIKKKLKESKK
jgi:bacterioferritin-associated ferredoxin